VLKGRFVMLVQRVTWVVREGHNPDEGVALLKTGDFEGPKVSRVLIPCWLTPTFSRITIEFEFKDANTLETEWNTWLGSPGAAAWMEKWYAVFEATNLVNEVWLVPE
jgi:hypothetical protein